MDGEAFRSGLLQTLAIEARSIEAQASLLDMDQAFSVAEAIANCRGKIVLSACGTSGVAARKIAHTLSCVECPALFLSPVDAVHGAIGVLQREDILILLSKGGKSEELIRLIAPCRTKGTLLIGVSENPAAPIAKESDIFLRIQVEREPDPFNLLATASTLSVIAVFDAIAIAIMRWKGYTKDQFAVIHPGGAVGEQLLKLSENNQPPA